MAASPGSPATTRPGRTIRLSDLLGRPITDSRGESLGRVDDVVVTFPGSPLPAVKGLVAKVGGREVFVPVDQTGIFDGEELKLTSPRLDLRRFERRDGEVLLRRDVLGHRLIDVARAHLTRAADLELRQQWTPDGREEWVLAGVDTSRRPGWLRRLTGRREDQDRSGREFRDWSRFEPLIGHAAARACAARWPGSGGSSRPRSPTCSRTPPRPRSARSSARSTPIPSWKRTSSRNWTRTGPPGCSTSRSDAEIAEVLARMRADDAADAIAELPQSRRQAVLDLLPPGQRTKVLTLMGFNPTSAGGLMGVDFLALPQEATVADALAAVSRAESLQPEALTSVHAVDASQRLHGVVTVVRLLQAGARDAADGRVGHRSGAGRRGYRRG